MVTNTLGPMPIMVAMSASRLLSRSRRTTVVNTRVRSWKGIRKGACLQGQTEAEVRRGSEKGPDFDCSLALQ